MNRRRRSTADWNRLEWLPVVVDVPDTARNDLRLVVLALLERRADLPFVIGDEQSALIVAERRLRRRADERQRAEFAARCRWRRPSPDRICSGSSRSPELGSSLRE